MTTTSKFDMSLFDTGPIVVMAWGAKDLDGIHPLTFVTPNVLELAGYERNELFTAECEWETLIHPDDHDRVVQTIYSNLERGITSFSDQYRVIKKNGEVSWINDHTQIDIDDDGELRGMIGYLSDITDLITAQRKVEKQRIEKVAADQSAKNKVQFLANMSHEIRTPMNGVIGMADVLMHTQLSSEQKKIVTTIVKSGNALTTIINDILDFSKIDSNKIELEEKPFDIEEVIDEVVTLLRAGLAETNVDMLTRIQPDLSTYVLGDVGRFRQIIMNLIGNALKFTASGHVLVDVKGQTMGDQIQLELDITDTGIGIPPEKTKSIFEKFSQADNSTTREFGGTGLGLSISSSLAQLMSGNISVKSELGIGSTFTVSLCLPIAGKPQKNVRRAVSSLPKTVLVLDDNQVNLDIVQEQMNYMGHKSAGFNSPKKALNALIVAKRKGIEIDLLLIDFHMPKFNGEQFFELIKSHNLCPNSRVIFLTSSCDDGLRLRLEDMGAEAVLTKPVSSERLRQAISSVQVDSVSPVKTSVAEIGKTDDFILIAEDNLVNQMFFKQALQNMGLNFMVVNDGQEAFDAWRSHRPDLILMDVSMPKLNGKEASKKIRQFERQNGLAETPIIAVTAHAFKQDEKDCLNAGMNDFLSKPMTINSLKEKIDFFLAERKIHKLQKLTG